MKPKKAEKSNPGNNRPPRFTPVKRAVLLRLLLWWGFLFSAVVPGTQTSPDLGANFLQIGSSGATLSDTVNAQTEFRIGVQAYYRYAFNEAINAFERANSFRPGEPLVLDWLGRAYYRSGMEATALRQWTFAADRSSSSSDEILLRSRIETVRNRRSLLPYMEEGQRYVEAGRYPGRSGTSIFFRQPV
jgi:tetratricopeptide (TPR) repeat protein